MRLRFENRQKNFTEYSRKETDACNKTITFIKKTLDSAKKFLQNEKKNYPSVSLSDSQFENFAKRIEENINAVKVEKSLELSKGYKILSAKFHSPFTYSPEVQKKFDLNVAKKLLKKYPSSVVGKTIFSESPLAKKIKNYAGDIIQKAIGYAR